MEAFKGVLWDQGMVKINGQRVHKYAIVGVLLSDEPLHEATTGGQELHAGQDEGNRIVRAFNAVMDRYEAPRTVGDASDVLCSLDEFQPSRSARKPRRAAARSSEPG